MIDIGLSKIALIGVIALLVVGPERLPRVARLAGTLLGRAQRYIRDVKSEVNRTIELDELRSAQNDLRDAAGDIERSFRDAGVSAEHALTADRSDDDADFSPPPMTEQDAPAGMHSRMAWAMVPDHGAKAKSFRKKRAAHTAAVPSWYKRKNRQRNSVVSCAARGAAHRPRQGTANFIQ